MQVKDINCEYYNHPYYAHFVNMIYRGKKVGSDFALGLSEFNRWLEVAGLIPEGMKRPSIGRYDHSKGYVFDTEKNRWNFRWQELGENDNEVIMRQLANGNHSSQTGKSGFQTGIAQKASIASPNHNTKKDIACPHCDYVGRIPGIWRHIQKHTNTVPAAPSLNHISRQVQTCQHCGLVGKGPRMVNHIKTCQKEQNNAS